MRKVLWYGASFLALVTSPAAAQKAVTGMFYGGVPVPLGTTSDYVGPKFPEEARRMHYGEIEHRSIYGEASPDEAKKMHEEGIEFHPLPVLPEDRN